jgi:hypothetical protein
VATTSPARIDDDLYASAKLAGEALSRSASQQVGHWARIGRELEASATTSQRDIAAVLVGAQRYDSLTSQEQAIVRAEWAERMALRRGHLDLAEDFEAAGEGYAELDEHGDLVYRSPPAPGD